MFVIMSLWIGFIISFAFPPLPLVVGTILVIQLVRKGREIRFLNRSRDAYFADQRVLNAARYLGR